MTAHRYRFPTVNRMSFQTVQSEHCGWLQENLDEPLLQTVSEDIDTSWWKVGCELGIKFADMDAINDDFNARVHHSKALAVLLRWRQLNGTEATKTRLMHALIAAERKDIADKLAGILITKEVSRLRGH